MTAGAHRLHSTDSRINWRVNPFGIAGAAATVSTLWELSRETVTGLDQFINCHLGSSDRCRQQLSFCASRVYCKHVMRCHKPGFTVQRVITKQVLCHNFTTMKDMKWLLSSIGYLASSSHSFFKLTVFRILSLLCFVIHWYLSWSLFRNHSSYLK